ncbi:MAG TPA: hypothetical protein VFM17_09165 [Candidatus Eisenbacteria bacterium]|nr:hypothetical protein [Candidatus Eisenbacteria bacterium]
MLVYVAITIVAAIVVIFIVRAIQDTARRAREQKESISRLGFLPCPEEKARIESIVATLERNPKYRYQIEEPKRLGRGDPVYYYVKRRDAQDQEHAAAEEEILFPFKRRTAAGLVLVVKPSALASGFASDLIGSVATGEYDAQPGGLKRIEIPPDLKGTNIVGAMGADGLALYDLVDGRVLSAAQGIGDAGGLAVKFRDEWCAISSTSRMMPFKLDALLACMEAMKRA